ncbi:WXG100 family type VII secretion target [Nocardia vinacea]|uniref:WXG100 family type VII secretion target n=1 Tax=Nocardia vinacea TaxID=96468 RepID=UPI0033EC9E8C
MVMRVDYQGVDQHTAATFDTTSLSHDTLGQLVRHVNDIGNIYQSNASEAFKEAHAGFHRHLTSLVDNLNGHTNALNDAIVELRQVDDGHGAKFRAIGSGF